MDGCSWINIGSCGRIDTGGIRGEVAATAVEAVAAAVWFIGRGRSAKGCHWDRPFLFSYIQSQKGSKLKKSKQRINPARCTGLIWSSTTVRCKVSRRAILPTGSAKPTIGRHLGSRQGVVARVVIYRRYLSSKGQEEVRSRIYRACRALCTPREIWSAELYISIRLLRLKIYR